MGGRAESGVAGGYFLFSFTDGDTNMRSPNISTHNLHNLQTTQSIGNADQGPKNAASDRLWSIPSSYILWSDRLLAQLPASSAAEPDHNKA